MGTPSSSGPLSAGVGEVGGHHQRRLGGIEVVDHQHPEVVGAGKPRLPLVGVQRGIPGVDEHVALSQWVVSPARISRWAVRTFGPNPVR